MSLFIILLEYNIIEEQNIGDLHIFLLKNLQKFKKNPRILKKNNLII